MKSVVTKRFICIVACFLIVVVSAAFLPSYIKAAYAYNEDNYESAGMNFMLGQYDMHNMAYMNVEKEKAINLYDDEDNVIAKLLVVNRDGELDYVVLDFMTDRIDEYGFDQENFVNLFYDKEKIMYAGALNYAYYEEGILKDIYGNNIDEAVYNELMTDFKITYPEYFNEDDGQAGILSWNELETWVEAFGNETAPNGEIIRTGNACIDGVTHTGISTQLDFSYQEYLNNLYWNYTGNSIEGTCVPTALTNICLYYDDMNIFPDLIKNGSLSQTYYDIVQEIDFLSWGQSGSDWLNSTMNGMDWYVRKRGYDCNIVYYEVLSWTRVRNIINAGRPLFTDIYKNINNGNDFYHAVVTLGYDSYQYRFTYNGKVNSTFYYYLRICDGWNKTEDKGRYIDFNGFYDRVGAIDIQIS